jgi:AcrR family transcriptional regulator
MVQVKKVNIRDGILEGAFELFLAQGYSDTTLSEIARHANVSVSNIYNYFSSKLEIVSAIYEPWFEQQLEHLFGKVAAEKNSKEKLNILINGFFKDIPEKDDGFANLWLEAISTRRPDVPYSRDMLLTFEEKVSNTLMDILPPEITKRLMNQNLLTHLLFMAFDGFAINYHVAGKSKRAESIARMLTESIFKNTLSNKA